MTKSRTKKIEFEQPIHESINESLIEEKNIIEKMNETSKAVNELSGETLPKGNTVEQSMNTEQPETGEVIKKGRHKRDCTCSRCQNRKSKHHDIDEIPEKRIDQIATVMNAVVCPLIARKFKKEVQQVMLSKEQQDELIKLQPVSDFLDRPNWVSYSIMACSLLVINTIQANDTKEVEKKDKNSDHEINPDEPTKIRES